MPKLPILKPKEAIRVVEKAGFVFVRQKGSHKIYTKENLLVVIPYHNKDLKPKTLKHIIRQSGLSLEEFVKLS